MNKNEIISVINEISRIINNAYSPYSNFNVGCAVIADNNKKYFGVNVENKSYGLTICAERNAITTAVTDGMKLIKSIIIAADVKGLISPCGACREVIAEFADKDTEIILANLKNEYKKYGIAEILPLAFQFEK